MSKLSDFIDGLNIGKDVQPVSFSFHCEISNILDDDETNPESTQVEEIIPVDSKHIPFIP